MDFIRKYHLMNKDSLVAVFQTCKERLSDGSTQFELCEVCGKMPFDSDDFTEWISGRKAAKHQKHLKTIMENLGCYDNEGFINITHIASINDTFWAKPADSSLTWNDVSLYRNKFTEAVSQIVFEGLKRHDTIFSSTSPEHSPELAVEGSYPKCFRKERQNGEYQSDIFIYKRGHKDSSFEPYCEHMASEIAKIISPDNAVSYQLVSLHGKRASRCNLFTDEQYGYAPYCDFVSTRKSLTDMLNFFENVGSGQEFLEMLLIDAVCFNEDRHAGNYGIMFDNDTMTPVKMSPVFDLNLSLMVDAETEEFDDIGYYFHQDSHKPKVGADFTELGQWVLAHDKDNILRERLEQLKDFSFSFRGDSIFPEERVRNIESAVRRQAEAVLSEKSLTVHDVFPSEKLKAEQEEIQREKAVMEAVKKQRDDFISFMESQEFDYGTAFPSESEFSKYMIEDIDYIMTLDFENGSIIISDFSGREYSFSELQKENSEFYKVCRNVTEQLKSFTDILDCDIFKDYLEDAFLQFAETDGKSDIQIKK